MEIGARAMPLLQENSLLLKYAGKNVPRYTSYPTAPHFTPSIDGQRYASWLRAGIAPGQPVSLYFHVPFCREICHYCGCNTKASRRDEPIRAYAATLRDEIDLVSEIVGTVAVSHIHWGGGTPSLLPDDSMQELVERLSSCFDLLTGMEHAIELDPRYVTEEKARLFARLGMTRASLGVQDLNLAVQIAIGRVQPYETVIRAAETLRRAGIESLNFDVMYGLPRQTLQSICETAEKVVRLRPDRISLFGYAHVPWMKAHQRLIDESTLPGAEDRIALARMARQTFIESGYEEIGIDHFALPGDSLLAARQERRLRRNFQGYTTDTAEVLVGIGASSISRTPLGMAQNDSGNAAWKRSIDAGLLPIARGREFRGEDLLRGAIIEQLLCYFDADVDRIARMHDSRPEALDEAIASLDDLVDAGWVKRKGRQISIIRHAPEISRIVASRFDAYLTQSAARHSVAV